MGGQQGESFENCVPQGNVLMVQDASEFLTTGNLKGGTIILDFHLPCDVVQLGILNIPDANNIPMIDVATSNDIVSQTVGPTGNNGHATVGVGVPDASILRVTLPPSSALLTSIFASMDMTSLRNAEAQTTLAPMQRRYLLLPR